jgi:hypothetical protein
MYDGFGLLGCREQVTTPAPSPTQEKLTAPTTSQEVPTATH